MPNALLEPVEYKVEETALGTWRRHLHPSGRSYREFRSHYELFGLPFIHFTSGICPETGARRTATGIIAVGRKAVGFVAIGQVALGAIVFAQAGAGLLSFGQAVLGIIAVGQAGLGIWFGAGQLATGKTAIGQLALGEHVLAQIGAGAHVWSVGNADPEAVSFFKALLKSALGLLGL